MIKEIINIAYNKFCFKLSKLGNLKYRLKGYNRLMSVGDAEANLLKLKVLPIYNYLESYNRRNGLYTFIYSIILVVSIVSLI